jgi:hypothetical protein
VFTVAASFSVYRDFNSDDDLLNSSRLRASSSIFINSGTPTTISFLSHLQQQQATSDLFTSSRSTIIINDSSP